ncbi:putative lipid II flippase FtsW [Patescibacteria group bacterium]|nr:MAG: putative lipid II flippase FtsW [Patescibacteria group bacterium]
MQNEQSQKSDRVLVFGIFSLIAIGLVMVFGAGVIYAQTRFDGQQYYFFKRQLLFGVCPGLVLFYLAQRTPYQVWKRWAVPFFLGSLVLLALVFFPGIGLKAYGANRWIQLGSFSFQPSEMAKLAIIIYLAAWVESRGRKNIRDFIEGLLPFLGVLAIIGFLILEQPDMGTVGVITLIAFSIFFAAGARVAHLAAIAGAGIVGLYALIKFEPYRLNRLLTFLDPGVDPQGIGYHINQALIAIGSGGILGVGLGQSRQKFNYLPEPVGDSIFAIVGEELGFFGASLVLALFILIAVRGFRVARRAPDEFGKFLAVGITAWIVFQAFMNIGAITGIIPLTGVPLPFISYGGTSLVFLLTASGVLVNISKQAKLE